MSTEKAQSRINVLDHGFVRLVDWMGDDSRIVEGARRSYGTGTKTPDEDARLIGKLYRDRHTGPFEHVVFTFEVEAPIFVFRQWHRHRTWSYSEFSGRFSKFLTKFFVPSPHDIGHQSKTNKQVRDVGGPVEPVHMYAAGLISSTCDFVARHYRDMVERLVPREIARVILPLNTYTNMYATVDLHNLMHFLTLRTAPDAQPEIRAYADAILQLIEPIVPVTIAAWRRYKFVCIDTESQEAA